MQLEKSANDFYYRLTKAEKPLVEATVKDLAAFMGGRKVPFLVAGVGSLLRLADAKQAKDIDLAIVGLKYTRTLNHGFDDVIRFTKDIKHYFDEATKDCVAVSDGSGYRGSSPFAGLNEEAKGMWHGRRVEMVPELEEFGLYGSKGMRLCFDHSRPIDVQCVFNRTVEEWKVDQAVNRSQGFEHKPSRVAPLFYAPLLSA